MRFKVKRIEKKPIGTWRFQLGRTLMRERYLLEGESPVFESK